MSGEISLTEVSEPLIPYHFARQHGIVISPETRLCTYRADTSVKVLVEIQRRFGSAIKYQEVDEEKFTHYLQAHYSNVSNDAASGLIATEESV